MIFLYRLLGKKTALDQSFQQHPKVSMFEAMRRLSSYSRLIILLGVLLIGGLWLFVCKQANADYDRTIAETSKETMNLAKAFEEHVRRIVSDADKDLFNIKQAYESGGIDNPVIAAVAQNSKNEASRGLVAIYNDQGSVIASWNMDAVGLNSSDRDYFRTHQDADTNNLMIGRTITSRLGPEQIIPLTRRINNPDGSFGGIVYMSLYVDYFLTFYQKIDLGQDQVISIIGMDGTIRARQSGNRLDSGQDIQSSALWKAYQIEPINGTYQAV